MGADPPLDSYNPDPYYEELERELLEKINQLGIGPQGFGGKTTALKVNVEALPTHIAGCPVQSTSTAMSPATKKRCCNGRSGIMKSV